MRSLSVVYLKVDLVSETCDSEFHAYAITDRFYIYIFYVALACGQHNARSDWLRATSEQGIRQR